MSDLAAGTGLTPSGATRVVDRLVSRGLVARSACATDRRITHVALAAGSRADRRRGLSSSLRARPGQGSASSSSSGAAVRVGVCCPASRASNALITSRTQVTASLA